MKVHTAQLAGADRSADRLFVTDNAVLVLDGASAFEPTDVDPGTYAETLGTVIAEQLDADPHTVIADAVAVAITTAVDQLDLSAGRCPSSTVSVLRVRERVADLYVLGDSPIHYGNDTTSHDLTDERLKALPLAERHTFTARLRAGHGYGDDHRATLAALQASQRRHRNTERGYWIAEANPGAAYRAITTTIDRDPTTWAVLATDGAAHLLDHVGRPTWAGVAGLDDEQLSALLRSVHRWEDHEDPDGRHLPRAKRHDDKTIAAIETVW